MMITFSYDLEDNRPDGRYPKRYVTITEQVLDHLAAHNTKGTFFVVGTLAENEPELIKKIAHQGHEIAFHSYQHVPLDQDSPKNFFTQSYQTKSFLEGLTGKPVLGFRAPIFSLTPSTLWVVDQLLELGFQYSSSVLPAKNPLYGYPHAPNQPFRWANGLIEFPCPLLDLKVLKVPGLGGIYLRYLPIPLTVKCFSQQKVNNIFWTYCHPYDFDPNEKFFIMPGTHFITSLLLWLNRKRTFKKIDWLLSHSTSLPFADIITDQNFAQQLTTFHPENQAIS